MIRLLMTFVVFLVGVPLAALSLVITVAILKIGWDSIREKKSPDSKPVEFDQFKKLDSG